MQIISLLNAKGGVAKTTATINISSIMADKGKKIFLIDMDHQGNLTSFFVDNPHNNIDVTNVLLDKENINLAVIKTNFNNIDILPNYGKLEQEYINISSFAEREQTLKNSISKIDKNYDYIFIDCPPSLDEFVKNALVASDFILIPIKADASGYFGLARIFDKTNKLIDVYNPNLQILGIFSSDKENTRVYNQTIDLLRKDLGDLIFKQEIRHSKYIPESSFVRKPLIEYARYQDVFFDYLKLVEEIETKLLERK